MKFVEEVEENWWTLWFSQVWENLFPRNKWKSPEKNLQVGDICLKGNLATLGKSRYVICCVTEVYPDDKNLVRTVKVASRPRDSKELSKISASRYYLYRGLYL